MLKTVFFNPGMRKPEAERSSSRKKFSHHKRTCRLRWKQSSQRAHRGPKLQRSHHPPHCQADLLHTSHRIISHQITSHHSQPSAVYMVLTLTENKLQDFPGGQNVLSEPSRSLATFKYKKKLHFFISKNWQKTIQSHLLTHGNHCISVSKCCSSATCCLFGNPS